jgi:hypothetical protein
MQKRPTALSDPSNTDVMGNHRPRAIVFSLRHSYLNPTVENLFRVLGAVFELHFYGPGYTPESEIQDNVETICDEAGPFDAVFVHQLYWHLALTGWKKVAPFLDYLKDWYCLRFNLDRLAELAPRLPCNFDRVSCPKFLILTSDPYVFPGEFAERVVDFPGGFVAAAPENVSPLALLPDLHLETFGKNATDEYLKFCAKNVERILPFGHIIGESEFRFIPLEKRRTQASVPGAAYAMRTEAVKSLREASIEVRTVDPLQKIVASALELAGVRRPMHRYGWGVRFGRWGFRRLISDSVVSFTEGSRVRVAVRKYFEVPAFGALLAADPFHGAQELGFEDGMHYVACTPRELPDVVREAMRRPDWAIDIIANGQSLVRTRHSTSAYIDRFRKLWPSLVAGTYAGAAWRKGEFIVRTRPR